MKIDARAFLQDFHALELDLRRAVKEAVAVAAKAAEDHAKATTLYNDRTGNLRKSTRGVSAFIAEGEIRADMPYAQFVENGRPFIYQASKVGEKVLDHGLEFYCDQAINKAG